MECKEAPLISTSTNFLQSSPSAYATSLSAMIVPSLLVPSATVVSSDVALYNVVACTVCSVSVCEWVMDQHGGYDEDLYCNPFFIDFQRNHGLFDRATTQRFMVCEYDTKYMLMCKYY